jgi:predicted RNA-binding protein Jag
MEWVETVGRSVDEAVDRALDALGVDEHDAELVVVSEATRRWFGLVSEPARVRARVRPVAVRPKVDRREQRRRNHRQRGDGRDGGTSHD